MIKTKVEKRTPAVVFPTPARLQCKLLTNCQDSGVVTAFQGAGTKNIMSVCVLRLSQQAGLGVQGWSRQDRSGGKVKTRVGKIMSGLAGGRRNMYFNLVSDFEGKKKNVVPSKGTA